MQTITAAELLARQSTAAALAASMPEDAGVNAAKDAIDTEITRREKNATIPAVAFYKFLLAEKTNDQELWLQSYMELRRITRGIVKGKHGWRHFSEDEVTTFEDDGLHGIWVDVLLQVLGEAIERFASNDASELRERLLGDGKGSRLGYIYGAVEKRCKSVWREYYGTAKEELEEDPRTICSFCARPAAVDRQVCTQCSELRFDWIPNSAREEQMGEREVVAQSCRIDYALFRLGYLEDSALFCDQKAEMLRQAAEAATGAEKKKLLYLAEEARQSARFLRDPLGFVALYGPKRKNMKNEVRVALKNAISEALGIGKRQSERRFRALSEQAKIELKDIQDKLHQSLFEQGRDRLMALQQQSPLVKARYFNDAGRGENRK